MICTNGSRQTQSSPILLHLTRRPIKRLAVVGHVVAVAQAYRLSGAGASAEVQALLAVQSLVAAVQARAEHQRGAADDQQPRDELVPGERRNSCHS